uniref:Uncharacterized protein n=1 Tax=Branchiostoma floridae TaxID=7739 RepID=C3Y8N1_BRAFL|eukprot:XP_002607458.1 hypothetical protein BRAFLDRAFT_69884 [Branchiostoma floridae]
MPYNMWQGILQFAEAREKGQIDEYITQEESFDIFNDEQTVLLNLVNAELDFVKWVDVVSNVRQFMDRFDEHLELKEAASKNGLQTVDISLARYDDVSKTTFTINTVAGLALEIEQLFDSRSELICISCFNLFDLFR